MVLSPFTLAQPSQLTIASFDASALAPLQALYDQQQAPYSAPRLANNLLDAARKHGEQVAIAWRGDQPVGCIGWVTLDMAQTGLGYVSPLLAADASVAQALLEHTAKRLQPSGCRRLRASVQAGEDAKRQALMAIGAQPLFDWVHFQQPVRAQAEPDFASLGLALRLPAQIDWPQMVGLYVDTFREVPNAPTPTPQLMADTWGRQAGSCALVDTDGRYQAFVELDADGTIAIGVRESWRGRGVAQWLYQHAGNQLAALGTPAILAMVASCNAASMRFHQKLGFVEYKPRGTVFELSL